MNQELDTDLRRRMTGEPSETGAAAERLDDADEYFIKLVSIAKLSIEYLSQRRAYVEADREALNRNLQDLDKKNQLIYTEVTTKVAPTATSVASITVAQRVHRNGRSARRAKR